MLGSSSNINAQTKKEMKVNQQDIDAIRKVIQEYYFKGIYEGNVELLNKAFAKGALLFGDIKGQPYAKTADQYLDGVAHRTSPKDSGKPFKSEILSIESINSIGTAKLHVKMYDFNYYNFITFNKIDGQWLIVNKTLTHVDE